MLRFYYGLVRFFFRVCRTRGYYNRMSAGKLTNFLFELLFCQVIFTSRTFQCNIPVVIRWLRNSYLLTTIRTKVNDEQYNLMSFVFCKNIFLLRPSTLIRSTDALTYRNFSSQHYSKQNVFGGHASEMHRLVSRLECH